MTSDALYSDPCRFCGGRLYVAPGYSRGGERRRHEQRCALSIDCPYCKANIGQRCVTRRGTPSETHRSRRSAVGW